jgi:nitrite reductase/ring-hydroxylating ferredoxin subunit
MINEKKENEARGIFGRQYLTCQRLGEVFEVRDGLACRHPKEKCKYRLDCPIDQIGRND